MPPSPLLIIAALLPLCRKALAHGYVAKMLIDGTEYIGNAPGGTALNASIIRQVATNGPVQPVTNPDLTCGPGAQRASNIAKNVRPGSHIQFFWADNPFWIHQIGPLMTYMASCGDMTCDKFDASGAGWFKVDQVGRIDHTTEWVQARIYAGYPFNLTIPMNIAPGNYLIRHEIIALHAAQNPGGAEFYPSCSQIELVGNGTVLPNDTVSFPGAYSADDPGITLKIYDLGPSDPYIFPGPPIANFSVSNLQAPPPVSAQNATASPIPSSLSDPPPERTCSHRFRSATTSSSATAFPSASSSITISPSPQAHRRRRRLRRL